MKAKRCTLSAAMSLLVLCAAFSQGTDPKTVTPAWVMEKQFVPQEEVKATNVFNVFFVGYDYPTLSGPLADDLASWSSPLNFSIGMESGSGSGSSFLTGVEAEFSITVNDTGSRFLMNDMVMLGYSFDLQPVRLNVGGRVGLSIIDVMSPAITYTGLGVVLGPEASVYVSLDPNSWIWLRGRYSTAYYMSMDDSANPISAGRDSLDCLSLEAGLAFNF